MPALPPGAKPMGTQTSAKVDPAAEALSMLRAGFPRSAFSLKDGNIVTANNVVIATQQEIVSKSKLALVQQAAPRLKAIEDAAEEAARKAASDGQ